MDDTQATLIAEQLKNAIGALRTDIQRLETEVRHQREFTEHRLKMLEEDGRDHEQRLRDNTAGVTQFKVWSGLASGGSGLMSIAALLKSFLP
jgi:hypothetical protein